MLGCFKHLEKIYEFVSWDDYSHIWNGKMKMIEPPTRYYNNDYNPQHLYIYNYIYMFSISHHFIRIGILMYDSFVTPNPRSKWVLGHSSTKSPVIYPLVNIQKTMENHHFSWENQLFLWLCSTANCNKLPEIYWKNLEDGGITSLKPPTWLCPLWAMVKMIGVDTSADFLSWNSRWSWDTNRIDWVAQPFVAIYIPFYSCKISPLVRSGPTWLVYWACLHWTLTVRPQAKLSAKQKMILYHLVI